MDEDGDYARLQDLLVDYDDYNHITPSLGFVLSRRAGNTDLGSRTLSTFKVDLGDWILRLPDEARPVLSGDIAMDGNGHLAVLWTRKVGKAGDPLGLYWQRFTGPLGEGCSGAGATRVGSNGPDIINGTTGNDVIHGRGGDDLIHGNGGNDVICGGPGRDRLFGDAGTDYLFGGDGDDALDGGFNVDFADGGAGTDICTAESRKNCP